MGRAPRITEGGYVYYVVNRGFQGRPLFAEDIDYERFIEMLKESLEQWDPRLLAYTLLPNQWHMLVVPRKDGDLSKWSAWLTSVHAMRSKHLTLDLATNSLYERRFRSFPVQDNARLIDAIHWIEQLPLREVPPRDPLLWKFTSLQFRIGNADLGWLSQPPVAMPQDWQERIEQGVSIPVQEQLLYCIDRGAPYGEDAWVKKMAKRFQLETTLRPRGRPPKGS